MNDGRVMASGGGVATEKTSPKFEICSSVRFFSVFFFGFFRGTFSVFFGLNFDKKFQPFKNCVNNVVLGGQELPNNTLNAYRALGMSYKSYYNQQEHLTRTRKTKKNGQNGKTEENRKKPKKPIPNLKFAVAFVFLGCNYLSGVKIGALLGLLGIN